MQTKEKETYNGWTNYETWVVNLWIGNDQGSYNFWNESTLDHIREFTEQGGEKEVIYKLSQTLKNFFEDANPLPDAGVYTDLLNAALSEVNWYEIAEGLVEEAR